MREGYSGPIYCTPATADLAAILLPDSGRIQEEDARYANKKGFTRHKPAEPLCTERDARKTLQLLETVPFDKPFEFGKAKIHFRRSGHILGAASVAVSLGRAAGAVLGRRRAGGATCCSNRRSRRPPRTGS